MEEMKKRGRVCNVERHRKKYEAEADRKSHFAEGDGVFDF